MATETARPDAASAATLEVVERFNAATNRRDVDGMMALMAGDVVFENTFPAPDGQRHQGQAAVRACWVELFRFAPDARFETEEIFAAGDRCVVRWLYRWAEDRPEAAGHVRGVDIFRIRDGKITEKLSYVKG